MAQIVPIATASLKDLARKINAAASKAFDSLEEMAIDLARAHELCRAEHIPFKEWLGDNIKLSLNYAYQLARCGEAGDPRQAIEDMRSRSNERKIKHREKVSFRNDSEEDNEEVAPGELTSSMRIRGLLYRAKEAKDGAEADDMQGIEITDELRGAVADAAEAWVRLLSNLEGDEDENS